jgi:hypothetical protein
MGPDTFVDFAFEIAADVGVEKDAGDERQAAHREGVPAEELPAEGFGAHVDNAAEDRSERNVDLA